MLTVFLQALSDVCVDGALAIHGDHPPNAKNGRRTRRLALSVLAFVGRRRLGRGSRVDGLCRRRGDTPRPSAPCRGFSARHGSNMRTGVSAPLSRYAPLSCPTVSCASMISSSLKGTMLMPAMSKSPSTRNYQLTGGNDAGSKKNLAHGDTPDPCMAPLPPGGLQNSAAVAAFWLGRPFAQTTASCVRFVTPNLCMICRTRTLTVPFLIPAGAQWPCSCRLDSGVRGPPA